MRTMLVRAILPFSLLISAQAAAQAPAPAPAAGAAPKPQMWEAACKEDVKKLCLEAIKTNTVPECLASKEKDLSEECTKSFLYKYQVRMACKDDIDKLCGDVVKSGGSVGQCFKEHDKDLSEKCRTALVKGSKKFKAETKAVGAAAPAETAPAKPDAAAEAPKKKTPKKKK